MTFLRSMYIRMVALLLVTTSAWSAQTIEAWSYYPAPPFETNQATNEGLTEDLIAYLNKALAGKYDIRLVILPRARMNKMLEEGERAFAVFVPSAIFGGPNGGSYLWTAPLFKDAQELISRKDRPFEFTGPESLVGVPFGVMLGHVYPMIAKEMEQGQIRPDRASNEGSLVSMLMARHADVITLPNSAISYFMKANATMRQTFVFSKKNLGDYTRHLMFQQGMEKERDDFDRVVRKMATDPVWIATMKKYGLEPAPVGRKSAQ